jgi:hypothetical protein
MGDQLAIRSGAPLTAWSMVALYKTEKRCACSGSVTFILRLPSGWRALLAHLQTRL